MAELRWSQTSLFLIVMLHFTAVTGRESYITVRDGAEVTLSCGSVMTDQDKCDSITWFFTSSIRSTVYLVKSGQIVETDQSKSDRLSVTANCSLLIKEVTDQDAGFYACRQFNKPGGYQYFPLLLSVVTMTEQKEPDKMTLTCSVSIYDWCRHTVEWMFRGQVVVKDRNNIKISQSICSAAASFLTSQHIYTSNPQSFTCRVSDPDGRILLYDFSPQLSDEEPGQNRETTTKSTTTGTNQQTDESSEAASTSNLYWLFILLAAALVAFLIIVVVLIRRKRTKVNKMEVDGNNTDPEDAVSYASISFSRGQSRDDAGGGDAVIYSAVKASSSPADADLSTSHNELL